MFVTESIGVFLLDFVDNRNGAKGDLLLLTLTNDKSSF